MSGSPPRMPFKARGQIWALGVSSNVVLLRKLAMTQRLGDRPTNVANREVQALQLVELLLRDSQELSGAIIEIRGLVLVLSDL